MIFTECTFSHLYLFDLKNFLFSLMDFQAAGEAPWEQSLHQPLQVVDLTRTSSLKSFIYIFMCSAYSIWYRLLSYYCRWSCSASEQRLFLFYYFIIIFLKIYISFIYVCIVLYFILFISCFGHVWLGPHMQTAVDQTPTVKLHGVMQPFWYNIVLSFSNFILC